MPMISTLRRLLLGLVAALLVGGCATTGSMRNAPLDAGVSRVYGADFDRTLAAARQAVVEAGLQVESASAVDEDTWTILAKRGASVWSWGELVRVAVQREAPAETRVTVHSQRRLATNVSARGDYSEPILSNLDLLLR